MKLLSMLWASLLTLAIAGSTLPLWTITSGPTSDLRRMSVDMDMTQQNVLANVESPNWPVAIEWISVHSGVAYWTDNFPWPGVRKFDSHTAVLGQLRTTMLEDQTGVMSFGSVTAGNSSVIYVVESNSGSILAVNKSSTVLSPEFQILKTGFTNISGIVVNSESTTLYWLADGGLYSGNTSNANFSLLLDLLSLIPPSTAPKSLALSQKGNFLVWTDLDQNGIYRFLLTSTNVSFLSFNNSNTSVFGVATEPSTSSVYVSVIENVNNTRVARVSSNFTSLETTVFFDHGTSPCCGVVLPIAIDALYISSGACSAGTYSENCLACQNGTFASVPLQSSCPGVCSSTEYCAFATAFPIPSVFAQNHTESNAVLFVDARFGNSDIPNYFLIGCLALMGFLTIFFALLLVGTRIRHYRTVYPKLKYCCQKIDICYRSKHYNETPAVMLHRKSVIGGFQSLLFPGIFIVLAVYIGIQWNASPIISTSLLPFSLVDQPSLFTANYTFSAIFWGFSGTCDEQSVGIMTQEITPLDLINVSVVRGDYSCNVTWNTRRVGLLPGQDAVVRITMQGGHAAFVGYEIVIGPHYLRGVPVKNSNLYYSGWNIQSGTIMPTVNGAVFKGLNPTQLNANIIYAQLNDTTLNAPFEYQNGWLLGTTNVIMGGLTRSSAEFLAADNSVSMQFTVVRSPTYLRVLVQQTGTFLLVLGSIFAYMNTLRNGVEMAGKTLEWIMFTCCKKQRTRHHEFFMRPFEGTELRSMMGFHEYSDDTTTRKVMKRNEVRESV